MTRNKSRSKKDQDFITNLHATLKPLGFKKKTYIFKAENGFYKLINIQKASLEMNSI